MAVEKIVQAGIPVMGHVGLTPQSVHAMGGFKVQGRHESEAKRILEEAHVGVTPGIDFGSRAEGWLRFSFANNIDNINEALRRLEKWLPNSGA